MKILLAPVGSRGDVQPMLGLAVGLKRAGHDVTFFAAENYRAAAEAQGIRYTRGGRDVQTMVKESGEGVRNPWMVLKLLRIAVTEQFELLPAAAKGADIVAGSLLAIAGPSVCERMKLPFYWVSYFPNSFPTRELPAPTMQRPSTGPFYNRFSWWMQAVMTNFGLLKVVNGFRRDWGLPEVRDLSAYRLKAGPAMLAFDEELARVPVDAPLSITATGFWYLDTHEAIPPDVDAFINAGPPPVYIGFGSMPCDDPKKRTAAIVDAVKSLGLRAIISRGWAGLGDGADSDLVRTVGPINHAALFPRMRATVHHGGAGTTSASARAGVPQVIVPHMFDQYYWAGRVAETRIGTALPSPRFKSGDLEKTLRTAISDEEIGRNAARMGEHLRSRDGIAVAISLLEKAAQHRPA